MSSLITQGNALGTGSVTITSPNTNSVQTLTLPDATGTVAMTSDIPAAATAPVFGRVVRTAGDIATTSTSLVDATGATVTFTTGAFPVAVGWACAAKNSNIDENVNANIMVDAALELGAVGIRNTQQVAGRAVTLSSSHQTAALTAASHTIKMQWSVSAGTGTIDANTNISFSFWANEIR